MMPEFKFYEYEFIRHLLSADPFDRLTDILLIKNNDFFYDVDWDFLSMRIDWR